MKMCRRLAAGVILTGLLAPSPASALASRGARPGPAFSFAQEKQEKREKKDRKKTAAPQTPAPAPKTTERLEPDDASAPADVPPETQANRREQLSEEEAAVVPYYNNFMSTYRLGPEDVISIRVFDQERYSMSNVTVPPDGRISYWFVRDGLMVNGKTTRQVADEITKYLDEYLIDPKVNVTLEKAMSARYSVIGDVAQPGVRVMTKRLTVYEALYEAGGVLSTGDKKKIMVLRQQVGGTLQQIPVDLAAIEKGRALNNQFLAPGDQIVVPGNRLKKVQAIINMLPVLSFARIFTGGF